MCSSQHPLLFRTLRNQVRFTVLEALPLVSLTAALLGGVTLLQVLDRLSALGASRC